MLPCSHYQDASASQVRDLSSDLGTRPGSRRMHQQVTLTSEESNVLTPLIAPISRLTIRVVTVNGINLLLRVKHLAKDIHDT
jgi:hypothetical protein